MYMGEEEAFHCLGCICEKIVPGYYTPSLSGVKLDQHVIEKLVHTHLPELYQHFFKTLGGLAMVTYEWLVGLYASVLPLPVSLIIAAIAAI
jgi:hypothetical protein